MPLLNMRQNQRHFGAKEETLSEELDAVDARILDLLQRDASLSIADIAEKVASSSPAYGASSGWRRGRDPAPGHLA